MQFHTVTIKISSVTILIPLLLTSAFAAPDITDSCKDKANPQACMQLIRNEGGTTKQGFFPEHFPEAIKVIKDDCKHTYNPNSCLWLLSFASYSLLQVNNDLTDSLSLDCIKQQKIDCSLNRALRIYLPVDIEKLLKDSLQKNPHHTGLATALLTVDYVRIKNTIPLNSFIEFCNKFKDHSICLFASDLANKEKQTQQAKDLRNKACDAGNSFACAIQKGNSSRKEIEASIEKSTIFLRPVWEMPPLSESTISEINLYDLLYLPRTIITPDNPKQNLPAKIGKFVLIMILLILAVVVAIVIVLFWTYRCQNRPLSPKYNNKVTSYFEQITHHKFNRFFTLFSGKSDRSNKNGK